MLLAPQNLLFSLALGAVVVLGALQMLLGIGDAVDIGDLDVDGEVDTPFESALDWLYVGRIPLSILFILWCLSFSGAGFGTQIFAKSRTGELLPLALAAPLALVLSLPLLKLSGWILRPILPRDETESVSIDSFLGLEAQITVGTARNGKPAEARVRDKWGKTHYIMVEPENIGNEFAAGQNVLLVGRRDHVFRVVAGTVGD